LPRILIVDDDPDLLGVCSVGLTALGHEVWTAQTGADGLGQVAIRAPEVIVLDLGLPDQDGLAVCRRIRTWSDVPIVVLSADGSEDRKVDALDQGADDYMTKPFSAKQLAARMKAVMRRCQTDPYRQPASQVNVGDLVLDLQSHEVTKAGKPVQLTRLEFRILYMLALNEGRIIPYSRPMRIR
jgi:two-component system KDP operon response regulator KdpE